MKFARTNLGFENVRSGFSTIELLVALSLFAVVSVAAIQFVTQNEISLLKGQNELTAHCHIHRPATPEHERICGHYREWGGMPNDPIVKSASSVSVDMNTHNKYCKSTP